MALVCGTSRTADFQSAGAREIARAKLVGGPGRLKVCVTAGTNACVTLVRVIAESPLLLYANAEVMLFQEGAVSEGQLSEDFVVIRERLDLGSSGTS